MTVTETPAVPFRSYPRRPDPRGPQPSDRRTTRRVAGGLLAVAAGVIVTGSVVLAFAGVLVTSSPPDTAATIDPLVHDSGLTEEFRDDTDGAPAFDHPASVRVTAWSPAGAGEPACVLLYRAAAAQGWSSQGGVTTASCTALDTRFGGTPLTYRSDTVTAPDGTAVDVSWDVGTGLDRSVTLSQEEVLDA